MERSTGFAARETPAAVSRASALVAGLALVFVAAHLISLPPTLEDLDSVNFALGIRDFDVARHQPHPPGYPAFIALAKVSTALFRLLGASAPEVKGLAIWSAAGGGALLVAAFLFFLAVTASERIAILGVVLLAASPLFWFSSLRPLSDVAGLAVAFGSLAALAMTSRLREDPAASRLALLTGAALAGLAIGFRSQMAVLTAPLLALALLSAAVRRAPRVQMAAVGVFASAVLLWVVPLVVASGGPGAYVHALGSQAGEDYTGVVMLWTNRTVRVAMHAFLNTFVLPWHSPLVAGVLLALALAGALVTARSMPHALTIAGVVFGPYTVFHLLFQETVTVRYALPIVPCTALLAAVTLAQSTRALAAAFCLLVVASCLVRGVPAGVAYGRAPSPIFSLLAEMKIAARPGNEPTVGMHRRVFSESRRARQWAGGVPGRPLAAPRDYEWLEVTRALLEKPDAPVWFLADPRRTDLALIDAEHRRTREYRWPFSPSVYVGGARPGEIDWHIFQSPGWFLEQGWALTPEIAGITERDGWGPHRRPSVGWIRRRGEAALMLLGGRHLGAPSEPPVRLTVTLDERPLAAVDVSPGFFMRFIPIPAGALSGDGPFARLGVAAASVGGGETSRVGLEQFNLQPTDVVQFGFAEGWFEPEYNPRTARYWRWMSESAALRIHAPGRAVRIQVRGESPLRYYDRPPNVRITAAGRVLAQAAPEDDFELDVHVPADVLAAAGGRVLVESSAFFVPGDRDGSPDRRRLALRIYSVAVRGD